VEDVFQGFDCDIAGVSAGFDTYLEDWSGLVKDEDYRKIGKAVLGRGGRGAREEGSPCRWEGITRI
jgi:acetoin utilization deacetylase AcuC-like enzyme